MVAADHPTARAHLIDWQRAFNLYREFDVMQEVRTVARRVGVGVSLLLCPLLFVVCCFLNSEESMTSIVGRVKRSRWYF